MLFTPVPGSILYHEHESYLLSRQRTDGTQWDLQDLNGKLLPFLEYNQQHYPDLQASDYLELEALMMHLNSSKVFRKRFDVNSNSTAGRTFRSVLSAAV